MTGELRTLAEVAGWLAGGLALRRVAGDVAATALGQTIGACANELPALPPPGVIADVAALLGGARLGVPHPIAGSRALRSALRAYDDDVLARLVATARFDDVLAAFAHVPAGDRPHAVALVVGALCERLAIAGTRVSPAALRRALAAPRDEAAAPERFADAYDQLAHAARHTRALVDERDVFALDHIAVLRDLGSRMTADHIAAAALAFERALPRRLPARRLARGARATRLADESRYPAGGFAAIAPGGDTASFENLVPSELAYMEDGAAGVDAFTVRYVEGELLYYLRDDSAFHRRRRAIGIALAADLAGARVKDREVPWQRLVAALGLVVAAIRWLAERLGDHALAIRVGFPPELAEERAIVALLLEAEIRRGVATIAEATPDAVAAATARLDAIADVVAFAIGAPPAIPDGLRALHVSLASVAPVLGGATAAPIAAAAGATAPWQRWCDAAEDVLRWLV